MHAHQAGSTRQKGFATAPMDGDNTGTARPAGGLSRPIGTQRHLTQLLEGRTLTIHELVRLERNATGETSPHSEAMQLMKLKIMNAIKSDQKDLTFHGDYPVFTKRYPLINQ